MDTIINTKYITADVIMASLARVHKKKNWDIDDVLEWCMQAETEIICDIENMSLFLQMKLPVKNHKALLPCNLWRLLDVYLYPAGDHLAGQYSDGNKIIDNYNHGKVSYTNTGRYLHFGHHFKKPYVYINFYGITVDQQTGQPLILNSHKLACEAFCVWNAYYEDFLTGALGATQWGYIDDQKVNQLSAATGGVRHMDRQDLKNLSQIQCNMFTQIANVTLYQEGTGE